MIRNIALGFAMLTGAAIGATAIQGLHAQGKAPGVYAVVDISEVTDPEAWKAVTQRPAGSTATMTLGGHYIKGESQVAFRHVEPAAEPRWLTDFGR